jgi:hypothetical protein
MTFLQDFLSLMAGILAIFLSSDRAIFSLVLGGGIVLAGLCWWACSVYSRLWNKRFKVNAIHHILCALAALVTLVAVVIFVALKHATTAAGISVEGWKVELAADRSWAAETFKTAYDRVHALGLEDFSKAPPPPAGSTIPAVNERSQIECAWTYATSAAGHFNQRRPYLSKIASASADIPRDVLRQDIQQHFATIGKSYPTDKAIALVGREIRDGLAAKLPRVVKVLRVQLIVLFLLCQLVPFGLVGWAAYRDLKAST